MARLSPFGLVLVAAGLGAARFAAAACVAVVIGVLACGGGGVDEVPNTTMRLSFEGTVKNANTQAPIPYAIIETGSYTVVPGTTDPAFYTPRVTTSTDFDGRFTIDDKCMSKDYLEARASGFRTLTVAVACAPVRRTMPITLIPL